MIPDRYVPEFITKFVADQVAKKLAAFWSNVDRSNPEGCWVWTGSKDDFGYGRPNFCGSSHRVHRVTYEMANGPIPEGMIVRHKCDNPPCVNPAHLELGTKKDNAEDRDSRGRSGTIGERNCNAKVTEAQVREIRKQWTGERGQASTLMKEYDLAPPAFYAIVRRTGWKHVV